MNHLVIKKCTVSYIESAPNIVDLLESYAKECGIEGMPKLIPNWTLYRQLESIGKIQFISATSDDMLIGLVTVLSTIIPHYSVITSVTESFYVLPEYRKTGAGLKLRSAAENHAKEMGAAGLLISSPIGSVLADVLEKDDNYKETNRVFFRRFI
jgi:GNAT superfamily N-acetyltransferase